MNADDRKALIKDIVDVIDARLIAPMERRLDVRFKALEKSDQELQAKGAALSGQHRAVTKEIIPRALSESKHEREGELAGIADAFQRIAYIVKDSNDRAARTEEIVGAMRADMQPRALVQVTDDKGGTSVRPASLVAAESSVRTENKQESLAKLTLEAALDTTKAKNNAGDAKKRATLTLIATIVQGVIVGVWAAYQLIHAAMQ